MWHILGQLQLQLQHEVVFSSKSCHVEGNVQRDESTDNWKQMMTRSVINNLFVILILIVFLFCAVYK